MHPLRRKPSRPPTEKNSVVGCGKIPRNLSEPASDNPKELQTRRLVLILSRPISFAEIFRGDRSRNYPYTLVELALDGPGIDSGGSGEMLAAAKIRLEKDGKVDIENLEAQPRRILKVTRSE